MVIRLLPVVRGMGSLALPDATVAPLTVTDAVLPEMVGVTVICSVADDTMTA